MTKVELSIVIPVYNEPDNIKLTLSEIKKKIKTKNEILIVYDRKTDTTLPVLKRLQKKYKNLLPIQNNVKKGPSGAIRTGLRKAKGKWILVMMADLCDDITQVDQMVRIAKKGIDLVCPSRYTKGGKQELDSPFKVGFPKLAGFLLNFLTNIPTVDPTNSYKLYSKRVLDQLDLKSTISFSVTLEITVKTHLLGGKIYEIPTTWRDRQFGKTNFKLGRSIVAYSPWFFLALFKNRLFDLSRLTKNWL